MAFSPVRACRLLVLSVVLTGIPLAASAADFIGAETCRSCHASAYEQWRESPHARAHQSLPPEQRGDVRCLQCHAPNQAVGGDPGVSCETCHGAGEYYWPNYVMRDPELARATGLVQPDAKSCGTCHDATSPSLTPFDAKAKMAAIDHWTADREARKLKKAAAPAKPPAGSGAAPVKEACTKPGKATASRAAAPVKHVRSRPYETVLGQLLVETPAKVQVAASRSRTAPVSRVD